MSRRSSINIFLIILVLFAGCKKDLLHFKNVVRLNSNTQCTINNIRFLGKDVCVGAGGIKFEKSVIVRSTDGGYTWTATNDTNAPKQLYGMGIAGNGNIYLSGIDGDVLHSADTGKTWQFNRIDNWLGYVGGSFINSDTGIFVSTILQKQCTITRVTPGFKKIDEQTHLFGANNVYNTDSRIAYLIGYGTVMKTANSGNTWQFQDVEGDNFMAMDIHGDEIWLCGYTGSIFHTYDGGEHWKRLRNGSDISLPRYNLLDIRFKDGQNGWAVCDDGRMIRTTDGGNHWMEYDRFTTSALRSIAICPNGDLLVAGDNGGLFRVVAQ